MGASKTNKLGGGPTKAQFSLFQEAFALLHPATQLAHALLPFFVCVQMDKWTEKEKPQILQGMQSPHPVGGGGGTAQQSPTLSHPSEAEGSMGPWKKSSRCPSR